MADALAGPDLSGPLETLFRFGVVGDLSDEQLLRRYLIERGGGDEAAFALLVERHGPMVLRVCRDVLGNPHDAEDAFQAAFLVLARKAASIRDATSLAGWLHGVAHRIALHARSRAVRRKIRERRIGAMRAASPGCEASREESWAELHEEVSRLPRRFRQAIVLCYLEGLSTEEAAVRVGCPAGTMFSRLSRARARLRARLVRRGLAPCATLFEAGSKLVAPAVPRPLLGPTVEDSLVFAGRRATEAVLASSTPTALAKGLLHIMTFSKLAILSAAALSCALAMGGVRTFGWLGGPAAGQRPSPVGQEADDERAGLTRSVEKIQAEVDQTARRTDELKKELQQIRAQLTELLNTPRPAFNREAVARMAALIQPPEARAVAELADVLKRHPPLPSARQGHSLQLYLLDLLTGGTTLVVDEALPGKTFNGSAKWSHDGKRIVFAAEGLGGRHVMVLEVRDGRPSFTDLGPGTCPSFSRDDKRIAFLLNPGDVPGQEAGIWVMQSDGSERQRVGDEAGAPVWSPDGREFLMNSFSDPSVATVINLEAVRAVVVAVPGYRLFSWAKWAGPGQLVACIGTKMEGEMIALLDVRDPAGAKIIKVLWRRGPELDVFPRWPLYSPESGRCFFVGVADGNRRALYSVERGDAGRAVRMVPGDLNGLAVMDLSPDGRYLVFAANQPE